jgi:hypothetical protein
MSNRRRGRPPDANRPQIIADAAIRLLSEGGTRSLSHRRVDMEAGLPIGSAVNLAPTRGDLLLMAARRLIEISMAEVGPLTSLVEVKGDALTVEDVAHEMIELWRKRLGEDQIYRLRAEMAIHSSREMDEIQYLFRPYTEVVARFWQDILGHLGSQNPVEAADEFGKWTRGLYYWLGVARGFADKAEERQIETRIVRFTKALLREAETPDDPVTS